MDILERLSDNEAKLNSVKKTAMSFVDALSDKKSFVEIGTFTSGTKYSDGVEALGEGIVTGYAAVESIPVYLFVQNFEAMRGSFSLAQSKKIENCINMAVKSGTPFISVIDSAGARLDEGAAVLEGYSKIIKLAASLKNVVPHIAVIKGACVGLMSAYAALADVVIIDDKAYTSLGSPTVVAAKADKKEAAEKLFDAETALKSNVAALSYSKPSELKAQISAILAYLSGEAADSDNPNRAAKGLADNVNADAVLAAVCDNSQYFELSANYGKVKTAFTRINGYPVGLIASFNALECADFKKIKKFVNLLDNYNVPLISIVDCNGAADDFAREQKGLINVAADAFLAMSLSDNPKISVICGNAIGLGYSLLAAKNIGFDYSVAFAGASIAPLSADAAVNFYDVELKGKNPVAEKEKLIAAYSEREGNPFITAKDGYVDNIIKPDDVRPYLSSVLAMLL